MGRGSKNDQHATETWGYDVYSAIPKSVWATVAWHLANVASGEADAPGAAERRLLDEISALAENGIIPAAQAERAKRALS